MQKRSIILILSLLFFQPAISWGIGNTLETPYTLDIREWLSSGDAGWQISFPSITSFGDVGKTESELRFKKINSPITIVRAAAGLGPEWTLDASFGYGSIDNGHGTDTDRDISYTYGVYVWSVSTQDISGDVRLFELNFTHRRQLQNNKYAPSRFVIGFLHYEDRLKMTNGVQTTPPDGPFPGLHSTYDFYWNALKIGAGREWKYGERLFFSGSIALFPFIDYQGEGFWNLRACTDFRCSPPSFTHASRSGRGYEASIELKYQVGNTTQLTAGYRYLYLKAENGTDITYFNDGTVGVANLDFVEVTRQGVYLGLMLRF